MSPLHEGDDTRDVFLSMTDQNLKTLKDVLERAETKSRKLKKVIEGMEMRRGS
jgi:uncharacterized protein with GYD domain